MKPICFKRRFFAWIPVMVCCVWSVTSRAAEPGPATPERPNVIIILADDTGWGDLGCYGQKDYKTPRLDKMADEGVLFKNFYVTSPICSPSRSSFLTGLDPARLAIHQAFWTPERNHALGMPDWLDARLPTLPKIFQAAGWKTGHFGKWHLGRKYPGTQSPKNLAAYGYDEAEAHHAPGKQITREETLPRALDFIQRNADRRFFMNVWFAESHQPYNPKPEIMEKFSGLDEKRQVYADAVYQLDEKVGAILDKLKQLGLEDKTLVIFTSDNGPETWADVKKEPTGGGLGKYYCMGETGGLRGQKYSLYEGGVREPFIIRQPGRIPAGKIDDQTILSSNDLFSSLPKLSGIEVPADARTDGEDMHEALLGTPTDRKTPVCWEWRAVIGNVKYPRTAVRHGNWKWVSDFNFEKQELYDLAKDPNETTDLSATHPEKLQEMEKIWKEWSARNPGRADPSLQVSEAPPPKNS